ncbi:MAG: hypothetical protein HY096_09380 [Nitrospinae bacterium]|nr:hypothetical protein [Nitrospinota bacterium]
MNYNIKMSKCFKCGRELGAKEEHMKMKTEKGKICYVCYNKYKAEERKKIMEPQDFTDLHKRRN